MKKISMLNVYEIIFKARDLFESKKCNEALEHIQIAIESRSDCELGYKEKGFMLSDIEKIEEALECFNKAHEINPLNIECHVGKAYSLYRLGNYEEAFKSCNFVIDNAKDGIDFNINSLRVMVIIAILHPELLIEDMPGFQCGYVREENNLYKYTEVADGYITEKICTFTSIRNIDIEETHVRITTDDKVIRLEKTEYTEEFGCYVF